MADQNNSFPMISEKNWWTLREKFRASIPATVTTNYVKTLLSLSNDNSANSNVINPLRRLGLIDEDNKPTPLANEWRMDSSYPKACEKIIKNVYSRELLDLFPEKEVERSVARNWFMSQGVGQGAADKMVALFSLLKSGEIKDNKAKLNTKPSVSKASTKASESQKTTSKNHSSNATQDDTAPNQTKVNRPNLHIDLQIHISPESTPEQIEAIFASMAKHLYGNDIK